MEVMQLYPWIVNLTLSLVIAGIYFVTNEDSCQIIDLQRYRLAWSTFWVLCFSVPITNALMRKYYKEACIKMFISNLFGIAACCFLIAGLFVLTPGHCASMVDSQSNGSRE